MEEKKSTDLDLDGYQEEIGGISRYQVLLIIALSWVPFSQSITSQGAIFLNAVPKHRCAIPLNFSNSCNISDEEVIKNLIPFDGKEYSSCSRYDFNATACTTACDRLCFENLTKVETRECDNGYVFDDTYYGSTVATEFGLVCERRYLDTIVQILFFVGFFIGSAFVGPLADWKGRKPALLIVTSGLILSSCLSAFCSSYWFYAIMRLVVGAFNLATFIALFTYMTEISDTQWRTAAGTLANLATGFSHTLYPLIAYWLRDWRHIQLTIGLLPLPIFVIYFFIPETPRWLLANNKLEEARTVVARYASSKGKTLTKEKWQQIIQTEARKANEKSKYDDSNKVHVWDLFRRPMMRIVCFNVMFSWFTISMVFYGLSLNGASLAGDPYINTFLNSFVEIFGFSSVYIAKRVQRKLGLLICFVSAGVFCISSLLCLLYSNQNPGLLTASTALAITGKFFTSALFCLIYLFTSEIFPTQARATGISLGSMSARVGAVFSPLILQIQKSVPWFGQVLFGVLSIISGVMCLLYPETSKIDLMTSMDETETYFRKEMKIFRFQRKSRNVDNENEDKETPEKETLFREHVQRSYDDVASA